MEKTIMPGNANFPLLSELLKNLLHMNVLILDDNKQEQLDDFEKKYCYNSVLQPMFTGDYLRSFHETLEERCICCLEDPLGTRIYLFRLEGKTVLLGPSVQEILKGSPLTSLQAGICAISFRAYLQGGLNQYFILLARPITGVIPHSKAVALQTGHELSAWSYRNHRHGSLGLRGSGYSCNPR